MDQHERRIREKAEAIWRERGSPAGGPERYLDEATELVAIEENFRSALKPVREGEIGPYGEPVEELEEAVENEGEFPTLTDQGEESAYPHDGGPEKERP